MKSRTFVIGQIICRAFGVFLADLSAVNTHFGTVGPLSMFFNIQPLFLQKTIPLYPLIIFDWDLNFGRKEIMDLAFVCP